MFFDTESIREGKRRLYILGPDDGRRAAMRECESAVEYKMSGNGSLRSWCLPLHPSPSSSPPSFAAPYPRRLVRVLRCRQPPRAVTPTYI